MNDIFETNTIGLDGIDNEKLEEMLRKKNPCCNKANCEKGDYLRLRLPSSVIICQGCRIVGDKKYGVPSVMPKGFVIPDKDAELREKLRVYRKCTDTNPQKCPTANLAKIINTEVVVCFYCSAVIPGTTKIENLDKVRMVFFTEDMLSPTSR